MGRFGPFSNQHALPFHPLQSFPPYLVPLTIGLNPMPLNPLYPVVTAYDALGQAWHPHSLSSSPGLSNFYSHLPSTKFQPPFLPPTSFESNSVSFSLVSYQTEPQGLQNWTMLTFLGKSSSAMSRNKTNNNKASSAVPTRPALPCLCPPLPSYYQSLDDSDPNYFSPSSHHSLHPLSTSTFQPSLPKHQSPFPFN
jgi:hypothetical protein